MYNPPKYQKDKGATVNYQIGDVRFTRVEYMSLPVPGELLGLTDEQVKEVTWLAEPWAKDGQVVISANAWFAEVADQKVVFDPVQAVDVLLRADEAAEQQHQQALHNKFTEAGFDPDDISLVLLTHIEGVGMVAKREEGQWRPFFPNAKIMISDVQLSAFKASLKNADTEYLSYPSTICWQALLDQGVIETYRDGEELLPGISAEVTGEHCDGHSVFHIGVGDTTFIGHLAVSPAHMATGPCEALNEHPEASYAELHRIAADGRNLIGPLWPAPAMGRWRGDKLVIT